MAEKIRVPGQVAFIAEQKAQKRIGLIASLASGRTPAELRAMKAQTSPAGGTEQAFLATEALRVQADPTYLEAFRRQSFTS